jgi:hypothetical protein
MVIGISHGVVHKGKDKASQGGVERRLLAWIMDNNDKN